MTRIFTDVHDAHCCPQHGCKYSDPDCTVESGQYPGLVCEDCEADVHEVQSMLEADLEQLVSNMTEMQLLILRRLLEKK